MLLAKDQADGGLIVGALQAVVDDVAVEVQLAGVLGFELALLQVDDDERPQPQVVEEQVYVEILVADVEAVLPADEGEALAEFEQELLQMADEFGFELAFLEWLGQSEKVEDVGVFERLLREVRLRRGVNIGPGGRIVIPADVRAALKVEEGDRLGLKVVGDELVVTPQWVGIERAQEMFRKLVPEGVDLVAELIADRRREAEKENEE